MLIKSLILVGFSKLYYTCDQEILVIKDISLVLRTMNNIVPSFLLLQTLNNLVTSIWLVTFLLIYVGVNGVHVMEYMHTLRVRNVQLEPFCKLVRAECVRCPWLLA